MEAVQRKMNIYGKYLPLIAKFSQELAGREAPPEVQAADSGEEQEVAEAEETRSAGADRRDGRQGIGERST